MDDEKKKKRKKEFIETLDKIKTNACEHPIRLKKDMARLLNDLEEYEEFFEDAKTDLEELSDTIDEHMQSIQDLFDETELNINFSSDDKDLQTILKDFQNVKASTREKMSPIQSKIKQIAKDCSTKKKNIEQEKKKNIQLCDVLKGMYDQVTISVKEFNLEIQRICSSDGKFDDLDVLKNKLHIIQDNINDKMDQFKRTFNKAIHHIETSDINNTSENADIAFKQERDYLIKELRKQNTIIETISQEHSVEARSKLKEQTKKKQYLFDRLTKIRDTKTTLAVKLMEEMDNRMSFGSINSQNVSETQSHIDHFKHKLVDLIENLDEQFELASFRIKSLEDTFTENECLAQFREEMRKIEDEIWKVKQSFQNMVQIQDQKRNHQNKQLQDKCMEMESCITTLRDEVLEQANTFQRFINSIMSENHFKDLVVSLKKEFDDLTKQINILNSFQSCSIEKIRKSELNDVDFRENILKEFRKKTEELNDAFKIALSSAKEMRDEIERIHETNLQSYDKFECTLTTIHDKALVHAHELKNEIDFEILEETNKEVLQVLQEINNSLKKETTKFNNCFQRAKQLLKKAQSNVPVNYGEIISHFELKSKRFDVEITNFINRKQDFQEKSAIRIKEKNQLQLRSQSKLLFDTQSKGKELILEIERIIPHAQNNLKIKTKLIRRKRQVKQQLLEIDGLTKDTKQLLLFNNSDEVAIEKSRSLFFSEKKALDADIEAIFNEIREIDELLRTNLKREEDKKNALCLLNTAYENVATTANELMDDLNQMMSHKKCDDNLKKELAKIEKGLKKQIKLFQSSYEKRKIQIDEANSETTFMKYITAEYNKEATVFEQKIEEYVEEIDVLFEKYSKTNQKKKEFADKLKLILQNLKIDYSELKQNITRVLMGDDKEDSYVDKDEMKSELEELHNKLDQLIQRIEEEFEKKKDEMETTNQIDEQFHYLMDFQNKAKDMEDEINTLKNRFEDIVKRYNSSDEALLARFIRLTASKMNLQLDDFNGLSIFKLPFKQIHSVPHDKLRRFELGQPVIERDHRYIILVGMTGSGKSLLINNMINYVYGVNFRDKFRFKLIVESEEIGERGPGGSTSEADSMTSWVSSFTLHWQEGFRIPYSLTIIDTPGFGDTRGLKYDEEIVGQIKKFFNDGQLCPNQEMTSICLLIQASQARITAEQKYIFDQVLNLFGKDMDGNICLLFTFADAQVPPALKVVKSNNIPHRENALFKFNNSAVFAPNIGGTSQFAWEFGYTNLAKYFENLRVIQPTSLQLTKKVLEEREQLRANLQNLQIQISSGIETLREIEELSNIIVNFDKTIEAYKGYKVKKMTKKCNLRVVQYSITNCSKCSFTCHEPCAESPGSNKQTCALMSNGYCTVCPGKCAYNEHTNGTNAYVYTPVEIEETVEEMLARYNVAINEKDAKKKILCELLDTYTELKSELLKYVLMANECSTRLEEIALRNSYLTNVEYIERLIHSEEHGTNDHKKDRLIQLRHIKDMAETLRDVKINPENLPGRVFGYEKKIVEIINTIVDEPEQSSSSLMSRFTSLFSRKKSST